MSNNKDFLLKNAVEVGGPTNVTLGTVTNDNVDLSTGNYFKDTPSGNSTYSISNAGDVQSFQLEVTGGTAAVAQNFSTTLYSGTGVSGQTITNGIDLAGDGGLVWLKGRDSAGLSHVLFDTERGADSQLYTDLTNAESTNSNLLSFNSNGFSLTTSWSLANDVLHDYASWTFKKAAKFFDVVTYTGDGTGNRIISHGLNSTPGMLVVRPYDAVSDWFVNHRGNGTAGLKLNTTDATAFSPVLSLDGNLQWDSTTVTLKTNFNNSGVSYVAYLFAHDTAADSQIKCGSFTTDGSGAATVNLGWEPQWILSKSSTSSSDNWEILDTTRGWSTVNGAKLEPNTSNQEYPTYYGANTAYPEPQGFTNTALYSNQTYIYVAIRTPSDPDITWPSSIEWAGGVAPSAPAVGETDVFTFSTDDGGTSYVGVKTADNLS